MPKRKKTTSGSNNNPLSSARKDVGGLWHRKSGAGYHLFLSYYGNQPTGVVSIETSKDGSNHSTTAVSQSCVIKAVGNSRAAKKRRRKKNSGNSAAAAAAAAAAVVATTTSPPNAELLTNHHDVDTSHPLIQAFNSQSNKHSHMKNFIHTLARPLPLTLRLRKYESANSSQLAKHIQEEFSNLISPVTYDSTSQIYQSTPGSNLCKFNLGHLSPELKAIVVDASMDGTLARQELGSMLPVLCLEAVGAMKRGSKVLDMCASPGSKTLQAVEVVATTTGKKLGRVIANDVHPGRLDSLREAVLRSGVPTGLTNRILYTNEDASNFPPPKSGKLFDAIICDVPCSGDGTIRKDPHILPIWSPSTAHSLHGLQLKILLRALELIKVGGTVCYSTCSLNPIEDEAVVSAALRVMNKDRKSYELLEWPRDLLPGFKRRPGVENWKVAFYDENRLENEYDDFGSLSFYSTYDDAVVAGVGEEASKSFWPHSTNQDHSLHRCTRLLPDDHDTGGFFLVLIKRI